MPTAVSTILQEVCSVPTAPFAEQYMVRYVEAFVRTRPRLKLTRDTHGNMLIMLKSKKRTPRLIFAAHIDHPGFVARRMLDARTLDAHFRGWVEIGYVRGTKVRFFDNGREIAGTVVDATSSVHDRLTVPDHVKVRVRSPVAAGSPGMFDQGPARIKNNKLYSRGVDDQGGVAAALQMLDALHQKPPAIQLGFSSPAPKKKVSSARSQR